MGTQITLHPDLEPRAFAYHCDDRIEDAVGIYRRGQMLVIDGMQWDADMAVLRGGLSNKWRAFKTRFEVRKATPEVMREFMRLGAHAQRLFHRIYPDFVTTGDRRDSFRPMVTGPEPLHFDTFTLPHSLVTSLTNVSAVPRVYNVGPGFAQLVAEHPKEMRRLIRECKGKLDDLSYHIRARTMADRPPMPMSCPRHRVELAPGSIWFFDAKTCSHEVVYGEGAAGFTWVVPNAGAASQRDLLATLP